MVALRRTIHAHPELSWQEEQTARLLEARLAALGLQTRRMAGTGVVVDLPGPAGVPIVMLRADTDALPVTEETGLPFASQTAGVMHACGHDGHTSMLMGALELLLAEPTLPAPVRLIWQPAEERGAGALAMMDEGVLEGVGAAFGGHVDRRYATGSLVVTEGAVNASTDGFEIEIQGQDAHGARPHLAVDALMVGSLMVMALQTIVSREVDPAHPSVLTVGTFQAGSAGNVIAGTAQLSGTIRAQAPEVRAHLRKSLARIVSATAELHGAKASLRLIDGTPPLINRAPGFGLAHRAAVQVAGADQVVPLRAANMGGEDFARFLGQVPGCYIRFGARIEGRPPHPAHSSRFDFDEAAMATAARWYHRVALVAGAWLASPQET